MKTLKILFILCLLGCQPNKNSSVLLHDGSRRSLLYEETLSTVILSEPPKMDWLLSSDSNSSWIEEQIMEGLVRFDLNQPGLQLIPGLATRWEQRESGKKWVFYLRDNVKWSDGVSFTGQHVLDAFKRILEPSSAAIAVDNIFPIKNAQSYNSGKISDFSEVGVRLLNPRVIEFELEQPMAFFPLLLTHHTTFPVRLDVIKKHGERWTEPENIVSLGPYKMIYWHHDSRMILERNDLYWGKKPSIRYLVFYMIGKPSTSLRMFDRGRIDFIRDLPSSEIPRLRKRKEFQSIPGLRLYYFGFKVNKKPFDNKKVRQAIGHAIDRSEVVKVLGGGQTALSSWVPSGMFGHEENLGLTFDVEKAKRILKEIGQEDISQWPAVVIGFNTEEKHRQVAENIQAQLKKNLGLQVELKNEEWKTYLSGLQSDSIYSLFRLSWVGDYNDPHNFMAIMTSYSVNNRTGWKSKSYDNLIKQGLREVNPNKRLNIYRKAQEILVLEEAPVIPILTDVNQVLVANRIGNYKNNVLDLYRFADMELKSE